MDPILAARINRALEVHAHLHLMLATFVTLTWSPWAYWCDVEADYQVTPCGHTSPCGGPSSSV